jgi:putative ABC transport system permease protein
VLVAALVALPVLAMMVASVWARTARVFGGFSEWRDGTDLVAYGYGPEPSDLSSVLPPGAMVRSIRVVNSDAPITTASGNELDSVMIAGGDGGPDEGHVFAVTGGSAPTTGEAWLSGPLADRLDLEAGDRLALTRPAGTWTVSGVGRFDADFDRSVLVLDRFPQDQFRRAAVGTVSTVDLPGSPSADHVRSAGTALQRYLGDEQGSVEWPSQTGGGAAVERSRLAWGWVVGALALAVMGIIIAAAFATSARRQLVTLGLLSANGASARLATRMLALQGFWTGVVGSVAGIGVGLGGLTVGRPVIERVAGHALAPYQFATADLVVIGVTGVVAATIAALVPARTATRVPVAAALAGRRPLAPIPRRLVPIGVALFLLGIFLLVVAASSNGGGNAVVAAAVLGGVLVLAGACCASPLAIETMSRATARVGRSWRFAGRSLGRTRHRSAAVVTAIAVTGAAAVSGSTLALSADESNERFLPRDAVVLYQAPELPTSTRPGRTLDYEASSDTPIDTELQRQVDAIVPSARWAPLRIATWDPAPFRERRGPRAVDGGFALSPDFELVVADPAVLDLYELGEADRDALASIGVLMLSPWITGSDGGLPEAATLVTEDGDVTLPVAARKWVLDQLARPNEQIGFDGVRGMHSLMITEEAARRAGLDIVTRGGIVRSDVPLSDSQKSDLSRLIYDGGTLGFFYRDVPRPDQSSPWSMEYDWTSRPLSREATQAAILGAALLLTLLVVAIGLSLSATESRDERDVLLAVGARPATLRRMAGIKAAVITLTGVLLAIPTGVIPAAAVKRTLDDPFVVPWLAIAGLVVLVPIVAGLAAWTATSIAQRARPIRFSNLAFE